MNGSDAESRGPAPEPRVSIIIRAKNEMPLVEHTLQAVSRQVCSKPFEVVFVDSGSADGTVQVAQKYSTKVIRMPPEEFTWGRALNLGIRASRGGILVFISAHCVPVGRYWLEELISPFEDPAIFVVRGMQNDVRPYQEHGFHWQEIEGRQATDPAWFSKGEGYTNAHGAIRRELWQRNAFEEDLGSAEDKVLLFRNLRDGESLAVAVPAIVHHKHRRTFRQDLIRRWRLGVVMGKVFRYPRHPLMEGMYYLARDAIRLPLTAVWGTVRSLSFRWSVLLGSLVGRYRKS